MLSVEFVQHSTTQTYNVNKHLTDLQLINRDERQWRCLCGWWSQEVLPNITCNLDKPECGIGHCHTIQLITS